MLKPATPANERQRLKTLRDMKLLDTPRCIDVLQLSSVERVAAVTNIDLQLFPRAASLKGITATTFHGRFKVFGVDAVFHRDMPARPSVWVLSNP